ncbi:hypothetical protein ACRRTK_014533 [Alexandromys fortis]
MTLGACVARCSVDDAKYERACAAGSPVCRVLTVVCCAPSLFCICRHQGPGAMPGYPEARWKWRPRGWTHSVEGLTELFWKMSWEPKVPALEET